MIKKSDVLEAIAGNPNCESVWVSEHMPIKPHLSVCHAV